MKESQYDYLSKPRVNLEEPERTTNFYLPKLALNITNRKGKLFPHIEITFQGMG